MHQKVCASVFARRQSFRLCLALTTLLLPLTIARGQTAPAEKPVLVMQNGSPNGYCRVAFSPDGKWLASSAEHGPVTLWDAATGTKVREFTAVSASVTEKLPTGGTITRPVHVSRGGPCVQPGWQVHRVELEVDPRHHERRKLERYSSSDVGSDKRKSHRRGQLDER